MTRINLVPPSELSNQHLFAEFRELKMIPKSLSRSIAARGEAGVLSMIPNEYVLGKGHVSFFYNKGLYLWKRYAELHGELHKRGINYDINAPLDPDHIFWNHPKLCQDYVPTEAALALIRTRIAEKITMKPEWYRWTPTR
jgi:deoxyribonuclease (pyrimidine dimer)